MDARQQGNEVTTGTTGTAEDTGTTATSRTAEPDHPGRGRGPGPGDRAVAGWAALRLDLWLEWYAVPRRTARAMRDEVRANLLAAADEPGGVRAAARRLGSVRELAREAVVDHGGPRWNRGLTAAVIALGLVLLVQMVLSFVYVDGLLSAGGGAGTLLGNDVSASDDGSALTAAFTFGGWSLLLVPAAFVAVARPWRLLRRS